LPAGIEQVVAAEAARLRLPLDEYVVRLLTSGRGASDGIVTGADLVSYWRREEHCVTRCDFV
jgi:hypothetical protein